jgi:hypothetical protein
MSEILYASILLVVFVIGFRMGKNDGYQIGLKQGRMQQAQTGRQKKRSKKGIWIWNQ